MKYCFICKKKFDTEVERCPDCGARLNASSDDRDEMNDREAVEIISTMMITDIL